MAQWLGLRLSFASLSIQICSRNLNTSSVTWVNDYVRGVRNSTPNLDLG